jgi:hypothetical protein
MKQQTDEMAHTLELLYEAYSNCAGGEEGRVSRINSSRYLNLRYTQP